jgi:hypothetical protein
MRLIDADTLKQHIDKLPALPDGNFAGNHSALKALINIQPTIEPQRTGRWIDHAEEGYVECPFCHSATNCDDNISDLHFCFSCGAKMEGER